jgi:hypothetical protein
MSSEVDSYSSYLNTPGNNVIYFDKYFTERTSEIYNDTENFKKITSGAFIFVMDIRTLLLVCEDIRANTYNAKFDLIVGDSEDITERTIDELRDKNYINIFKRICIFTYYVEKYKNITIKYPEVKGVYYFPSEVREFIKSGDKDTIIFRTLILITKKNYEEKYCNLHQSIKQYYGKTDYSDYCSAKSKAIDYLDDLKGYELKISPSSEYNKKEAYSNKIIPLYSDITTKEKKKDIIHNYTLEFNSVYKDFNYSLLRLNERFINSFSWFIANLQYSLDTYDSSLGLKEDKTLYKGMKLDIIELINYQRFEGQTICIPSFFSTSTVRDVAMRFGGRGGLYHIPIRKKEGKYCVIFTITHHYSGGKPYCYNIEPVSAFGDEYERLFLPFTFFKVNSVKIRLDSNECDIELYSLGNGF